MEETVRQTALQNAQPEDIRATLAVSQEEARTGGSRVINLAGGRTVTVTVPAGIHDGEEIHLPGQGNASVTGGTPGDLVLRVMVVAVDRARDETDDTPTARVVIPPSGAAAHAEFTTGATAATAPADMLPPASYSSVPGQGVGDYMPPSPVYQRVSDGPQSNPGVGAYPNYQAPGQAGQVYPPQYYPPQQLPQPKRRRAGVVTAVILVLLLLAGSGLGFYFGYYQPNRNHITGTGTSQTQTSGTTPIQTTAQAYQSLYTRAISGTPALDDSLNAQTASRWDDSNGTNGSCSFSGGSYHSSVPDVGFFQPCYAENTNFSNFAFQVDMTIKKGDEGGIIFRADSANDRFYLFRMGVDGSYVLYRYVSSQGSQARQLLSSSTSLAHPIGQSNEITVVAQGSSFTFYINGHYLNSVSDSTYGSGKIGVFGESAAHVTDVIFSNAKVWTL